MSNNKYAVSICVPIYGVEKYIERCAISLFEQTYPDIEYIFVNDCTPDKSIDILNEVMKRYPQRIPYIRVINHKCNKGLAVARNTAVAAAQGKFLIHVDSDDWIEKDCVKLCVEKQKESEADIVNFDVFKHNIGFTSLIKQLEVNSVLDFTLALLRRDALMTVWSRMIRTSLYKENMIYAKEGVNMGEDYQIIPKILYVSKKIVFLHKSLYHYNCLNINSYCSSFSENNVKQLYETIDILTDYFKDKGMCYIQALNEGKMKVYCGIRINSCRHNNKGLFLEVNDKIRQMDKKYFRCLSIPYRSTLVIRNFILLKFCLKIVICIKHKITTFLINK